MTDPDFRCGFTTVAGRPNVGKSTLINRIVGRKLSITSNRPQTTRHRILGIATSSSSQLVFVDTPGIHTGRTRTLNRYMNRIATTALAGVDLVIMVAEASGWTSGDAPYWSVSLQKGARDSRSQQDRPIRRREAMLPTLDDTSRRYDFAAIVPVSARSGENLERLRSLVESSMPIRLRCSPKSSSPTGARRSAPPKSSGRSSSAGLDRSFRIDLPSKSSGSSRRRDAPRSTSWCGWTATAQGDRDRPRGHAPQGGRDRSSPGNLPHARPIRASGDLGQGAGRLDGRRACVRGLGFSE